MKGENLLKSASRTTGRAATTGIIPGRFALSVGKPELPEPSGWRWTKLTDIARLESGHTPSRRHPEYWDGDISWIGIKDVVDNHGRTITQTYQHVTQLGLDNSAARLLPKNTVCLSRTASVGYVTVMGKSMATSQDFVNWVCSDEIHHEYLKFVLIGERASLDQFSHGTTHQTIYYPEVKAFHICLPPIEEQREIVNFLSTLDRSIENLRKQNETLEKIAQTLFKHWFIDFEFPDENGKPYKSSGGEMKRSSLGEIPAGWRVESLDEVATFLNGLALQKYPATDTENSLPVIKIREMKAGITANTDRASPDIPNQYVIDDGDVLFSWSGSLEITIWCFGQGALNQHLFKVYSEKYAKWFYYFWTLEHLKHFRAIAKSKATTMGHIQRKHLTEALCCIPAPKQLQVMNLTMHPILSKTIHNSLQIQTLTQTRDVLLPQLMSGKLRIGGEQK